MAVDPVGAAVVDQVRRLVDDLRRAGVPTGLTSLVEACAALGHVDLGAREEVRLALRCTLVKRAEHEPVFDALFDARFATPRRAPPPIGAGGADLADRIVAALAADDDVALASLADEATERHGGFDVARGSDRYHLERTLRALGARSLASHALRARRHGEGRRDELTERLDRGEIGAALDRFLAALAAATRRQLDDEAPASLVRIENMEIAGASVVELHQLRLAVRPLARRLAARIAHRRRQGRPSALDVRRTIRRSLGAGGVPLDPAFRRRHPHQADLWVLCDVSGSVAEFARFTIGLLTAIHDELPKLRSFLFVDDVVEVTDLLGSRTHDLDPYAIIVGAGAPLGGRRSDWGAALARFHAEHAAALTPRSTIVLSGDARTHDHDPRTDVMADLVRRTRGVWLLDPERAADWGTDDAAVADYRHAGLHVLEVRTLTQLASAVEHIIAPTAEHHG